MSRRSTVDGQDEARCAPSEYTCHPPGNDQLVPLALDVAFFVNVFATVPMLAPAPGQDLSVCC